MNILREFGHEYVICEETLLKGIARGDKEFAGPLIYAYDLHLTVEHARALAEAIGQCHHLDQVEFFFASQEEGAFAIILEALRGCQSLQWLSVDNNNGPTYKKSPLTEKDVYLMAEMIPHHKELTMVCLQNIDLPTPALSALLRACGHSTSLTKLRLFRSKLNIAHSKAIADMLSNTTSLLRVSFHYNELDHQCINAICKAMRSNKNLVLQELSIGLNDIDVLALSHLAMYLSYEKYPHCPIQKLDIAACNLQGVGHVLKELLTNNKSLVELDVTCNSFTLEDLKHIVQGVQQNEIIQKIDIAGQPFYIAQQLAPDPDISTSPKPVQQLMYALEKKLADNRQSADANKTASQPKSAI
ncbi:MAG: hypothetical protein KDH94_04470 [Coxiellaceae bacterium]|nr:hypothetical protein [Coxiellaceae bacterium]